jgi:hypothetical protein
MVKTPELQAVVSRMHELRDAMAGEPDCIDEEIMQEIAGTMTRTLGDAAAPVAQFINALRDDAYAYASALGARITPDARDQVVRGLVGGSSLVQMLTLVALLRLDAARRADTCEQTAHLCPWCGTPPRLQRRRLQEAPTD